MRIDQLLIKDNLIIVCNEKIKEYLLKKTNGLKNVIYKSYFEFTNDLLGGYSLDARIKLAIDLNISSELAEIKLNNTFLVNENYQNEKISSLLKIKKEYKDYLNLNPLIVNFYKNKEVIIINDFITDDKFFKAVDVLKTNNCEFTFFALYEDVVKDIEISECIDYKDEVEKLLYEICKLLDAGVDPKKIKVEMPKSYYTYAKEVFGLANIDLNINESYPLSHFEITKQILLDLKTYFDEDLYTAFTNILEKYNYQDNEILKRIISVFNQYLKYSYKVKDVYDDLKYSLKNTKYSKEYTNGISVGCLNEFFIEDDDYVFLLGFNQDIYPVIIKDDSYLLDYEREKLNLLTSFEKNKIVTSYTLKLLKGIKNLKVSYAIKTVDGIKSISSIVYYLKQDINVEINKFLQDEDIYFSEKLAMIKLGKLLDLYYKYAYKSEKLDALYNEYQDGIYRKYNNQFQVIPKDLLANYIKPKLILSYTTIDKYYKCGFLFFLEDILKIKRESSNEESLFIGSLIHYVLCKVFSTKTITNLQDFIYNVANDYILNNNLTLSKREKFYLNNYLKVLESFINYLYDFEKKTDFKIYALEKEYLLQISKDTYLKGFIDKILAAKINGKNYAIVVDYKTGSTDFDLNMLYYGLNMQIMFYFYYLEACEREEFAFAGGYLQGILPSSPFAYEKNKTYLEQLYDYFKLIGYSNKSISILKHIEYDMEEKSNFIKGIRFTKTGDFHSLSLKRVIDEDTFKKLLVLTKEKINDAIFNIKNGNFPINPKKMGNNLDACAYCAYKDICFKTYKDYVLLKKYQDFEFLGGNDDTN